MYNGIGLATVRGSATSGHVQKNMSYIKPEFFRNKVDANQSGGRYSGGLKGKDGAYKVNKDVIEHNKKHALEAKVYEYEDSLREGGGLTDEQIDEQVAVYRKKLTEQVARGGSDFRAQSRTTDTHETSARKYEENQRIRAAFGIREDFAAGSSFDPVAQEQRRKDREAERASRYEQHKLDRQRRDLEREQSRASGRPDGDGGRPAREKYVPKDRSGEARRGRSGSRSPSAERGGRRLVDSRDRKRQRSPSPRRRDRSPHSRDGRGRRRDSRSRERHRGGRARSPSGENDDREVQPGVRGKSFSPVRQEPAVGGPGKASGDSRGRSRSRSSSSSSVSSRSSSSRSSSSSGSSSSGSRSRDRSSSRGRKSPSPHNSPPRRKTRWGDK